MDYGSYTLSFRFPMMNDNKKNTTVREDTPIIKSTGKRTHPVSERRKKIVLPSLSKELPARIYRKSSRLQIDKNSLKSKAPSLVQPLFIRINDNSIDNHLDSSFLSGSNRANVLLRTITHSEKFSRRIQQQKKLQQSSSRMPTIPTTTFVGGTRPTMDMMKDNSTKKEFAINNLNQPRVTSAQILLQSLEGKRLTSAEKVKKWLNTHCAVDLNDSPVDQGVK